MNGNGSPEVPESGLAGLEMDELAEAFLEYLTGTMIARMDESLERVGDLGKFGRESLRRTEDGFATEISGDDALMSTHAVFLPESLRDMMDFRWRDEWVSKWETFVADWNAVSDVKIPFAMAPAAPTVEERTYDWLCANEAFEWARENVGGWFDKYVEVLAENVSGVGCRVRLAGRRTPNGYGFVVEANVRKPDFPDDGWRTVAKMRISADALVANDRLELAEKWCGLLVGNPKLRDGFRSGTTVVDRYAIDRANANLGFTTDDSPGMSM